MIKPLFDRVLLEPKHIDNKSTLILPNGDNNNIATVICVGNTSYVKAGDTVIYNSYATTPIEYDGAHYLLIKEIDILAIL